MEPGGKAREGHDAQFDPERDLPDLASRDGFTATTFQMPVPTRTTKAGQAMAANRRATVEGTSSPRARSTGTNPATVICPPPTGRGQNVEEQTNAVYRRCQHGITIIRRR